MQNCTCVLCNAPDCTLSDIQAIIHFFSCKGLVQFLESVCYRLHILYGLFQTKNDFPFCCPQHMNVKEEVPIMSRFCICTNLQLFWFKLGEKITHKLSIYQGFLRQVAYFLPEKSAKCQSKICQCIAVIEASRRVLYQSIQCIILFAAPRSLLIWQNTTREADSPRNSTSRS